MAERRILVLYWNPTGGPLRAAVASHLRMPDLLPEPAQVLYFDLRDKPPRWLRRFAFDVILLHTTLLCLRWTSFWQAWHPRLRWLAESNAIKIAFPQDEYDHSEVLDEWLHEMGVSVVFSNFPGRQRPLLYPLLSDRARFRHALTGYIDERAAPCRLPRPAGARPIDICYRAACLPYWFGSAGQLKHRIADQVRVRAEVRGLRCDISTRPEDTILGADWFRFLGDARLVIGCESGSSVLDRRGEIKDRVLRLLAEDPELSFEALSARMPPGWDGYDFQAISPRHFEAIQTGTAQVLVRGRYDGVLLPDVHYLPLEKDFSNLDEVLMKAADAAVVSRLVRQTEEDIFRSGKYTYARLARDCLDAIREEEERQGKSHPARRERVSFALARGAASWQRCQVRLRDLTMGTVRKLIARLPEILPVATLCWNSLRVSRALRQLVWLVLTSSLLGGRCSFRQLLRDLLRLEIARRICLGRVVTEPAFRVRVEYRASVGMLQLTSSPQPGGNEPATNWTALLRHGLRGLRWAHPGLSQVVRCRLGEGPDYCIRLCSVNGTYEFPALTRLAASSPVLVVRALFEMLGPAPKRLREIAQET